jgi:hypothetical protein
MNSRIKVIKHGDQRAKEPEVDRLEQSSRQSTREITSTIKLWVSEFKERRHTEEHRTRTANKLMLTALQ